MYNSTVGSERTFVNRRRLPVLLILLLSISVATACSAEPKQTTREVVVSAPADGVVRRVLVSEGAAVDKDAAIIEIAVELNQPAVSSQPSTPEAEQTNSLRAAETDLASAEGEANRTTGEVRRVEPLVRRGLASQAELDKVRAQSQDAQERLRLARDRVETAKERLSPPSSATTTETVIAVRVPAAGTVRTLSVHAGQAVKSGQPIATLGAHS
jgi:multidrug efflux pump subunit AcrA (membrane-fusion protein)